MPRCSRWGMTRVVVCAVLVGAGLPGSAFSQFSQPPQVNYAGGFSQHTPVGSPSSDALQLAGQTDQQLFTEARLFQQQGHTAQAQRIYIELQRRSAVKGQSQQVQLPKRPPTFGYAPSAAPSAGAMPMSPWRPANPNTYSPQGLTPAAAVEDNRASGGDAFSAQVTQAVPFELKPASGDPRADTVKPDAPMQTSATQAPVMVLDRQITPPTPEVGQSPTGWRSAVTPLPPALAQEHPASTPVLHAAAPSVAESPLQLAPQRARQAEPQLALPPTTQRSAIASMQPMELTKSAASDPVNELPNIPVAPPPDMPAPADRVASEPVSPKRDPEPPPFFAPATMPEHRIQTVGPSETAGVVSLPSIAPPSVRLSPQPASQSPLNESDQENATSIIDSAAKLAKQTDEIRIIPGSRLPKQAQLEALLSTGPTAEPPARPQTVAEDAPFESPSTGWKSHAPFEPQPQPAGIGSLSNAPGVSGRPSNFDGIRRGQLDTATATKNSPESSVAEQSEAGRVHVPATPAPLEEQRPEQHKPPFDLAALLKDPEFREIHTRPVLDGLELLSQTNPRHRLLGALRIGVAGPEGRTALPALRQLLTAEPNLAVRLRIAEAILKVQPNDRPALETLSHLLIEPPDPELRQAAASALGGAAVSGNPTAIVRLTDALDDASPRVRIMAALSLAQFGAAAIDAVPRLEVAASSDVPRMQRAALAALTAIRGPQSSAELKTTASTASDRQAPTAPPEMPAPESGTSLDRRGIASPPAAGDRTNLANASSVVPAARPSFYRSIPGLGNLEPNTVRGAMPANEAAPPGLWPVVPSRGISLHEIAGENANIDGRPRPPVVRQGSAELVTRPVNMLSDPAVELRPLTDDSPLNLESNSGGGKAGQR
jgi:HEAT repeat protein